MLLSRSLTLAVLGFACLAGGCDRQSGQQAQPQASASASSPAGGAGELNGTIDRSNKGRQLPEFTVKDHAGRELRLASLKGKPLLINLWATWCAPCIAELPMLDKLAGQRGDALKVLTVSQDMAKTEQVAPFLAQRGFSHLEGWLDPEGDLAAQNSVQTLPTTIYYDAGGREVWRIVGGHDWSSAETTRLLAEAER